MLVKLGVIVDGKVVNLRADPVRIAKLSLDCWVVRRRRIVVLIAPHC